MFVGTLAVAIVSADVVGILSDVSRDGRPIGESILLLQEDMFDVFGGFLLILLGIELISMVRAMVGATRVAVESILSIALIASARHVITIDVHHSEPEVVFGAGFIVLVLIVGFYLLRRDRRPGLRRDPSAMREPSGPDR